MAFVVTQTMVVGDKFYAPLYLVKLEAGQAIWSGDVRHAHKYGVMGDLDLDKLTSWIISQTISDAFAPLCFLNSLQPSAKFEYNIVVMEK